jgi:serine/threonine protein kinase
MSMTATKVQAGFEPIPGYVLREPLGSGGYGHVWLAEAPGGLKKAIKFVYGHIDEDRAANELKSLQRIRQVSHPFILSLERIEVVDGQLIIVTELAQGSMYDRYIEFRGKGFAGISREKLFGYLRDAADGLDFLCQQHDLQHLDVKPANLLLVADRVKVADFGLIKDIQSNSLSMMAGLTPTYAAPEMFDGRPGRFSDQYSLAIVYQEMLTGTLPFRGRTTAQLANEHLQKAPNLESIPLLERPVLSRALAKKPQMRFNDCKDFVHALELAHAQSMEADKPAPAAKKLKPRPSRAGSERKAEVRPSSDENDPSNLGVASRIGKGIETAGSLVLDSFSSLPKGVRVLPSFDVGRSSNDSDEAIRKRLILGLGGTGAAVLLAMRRLCLQANLDLAHSESRGFLLLDTDQTTIERSMDRDLLERLSYHSGLHVPLKSPQHFRTSTKLTFSQISRRWVYNIPRSLRTEGVRPLGVLALLDNAKEVFDALRESIAEVARSAGDELASEPIEVYLVSSAHGGTGGAIVTEMGFMIRQIAAEFDLNIRIELMLTCATPHGSSSSDLSTASALACLTEINHYFKTEGLHSTLDGLPASQAINRPPFDHVVLIHGGQCGNSADYHEAIEQASTFLFAICESDLGSMLIATKANQAPDTDVSNEGGWTEWISTVRTKRLEIHTKSDPSVSATRVCLRSALPWLSSLGSMIETRNQEDPISKVDSRVLEQIDFFVGDMFRSNRWTAQAWVHQCMACLVDNDSSQSETTDILVQNEAKKPKSTSNHSILNTEQKQELCHVCEQLAIEPADALDWISTLVQTTREKLAEWISAKWLTSPASWMNLRNVLRSISDQFSIQSNSLFVVADKLNEKHETILATMYNGSEQATSEMNEQLQSTTLEARFHSLAANMLGRLAEHLGHLEELWCNECKIVFLDLLEWVKVLVQNLGLEWDGSQNTQSVLASLNRLEGDDALAKSVRRALQRMMVERISPAIGLPSSDASESTRSQPSFAELFNTTLSKLSENSIPIDKAIETNEGDFEMGATAQAVCPAATEMTMLQSSHSSTSGKTSAKAPLPQVQTSLAQEFHEARPYFVEFGGSLRNMIVMPRAVADQIEPIQKVDLEQNSVTTIVGGEGSQSSIICIGEQLTLSDIVERVWMPSHDIWQLAHRLFARVDVEWQAIQ